MNWPSIIEGYECLATGSQARPQNYTPRNGKLRRLGRPLLIDYFTDSQIKSRLTTERRKRSLRPCRKTDAREMSI